MVFYSFQLSVPAQPDVVAQRIRRVVSSAPTFWGTLASSWKRPQAPSSPFLGSVENLTFRIRRNIQYRNSFLPMIRGNINPTPTGTRVNMFMYMPSFSLVFILQAGWSFLHPQSRPANIEHWPISSFTTRVMAKGLVACQPRRFFLEHKR